ncbi:hypothetical protein QJS10_CPA07g00370 [Acorus calamus]|uniref:Uncharacterized protein n=1 Tax=Acorus calamus TaxID=4465 RepID=A0AAV9EL88_ACOCL|nr:hypothetical protein QJS10_CPA07g00370 [Acorus calamus]
MDHGGGGEGGGDEEYDEEFIAQRWRRTSLLWVRYTLHKAVRVFEMRVGRVRQTFNANRNHNNQGFHEGFTNYWIMRLREALRGFNRDLRMLRGVIQACLNNGDDGEEALEQDLFDFDPHHPLHLPPAGEPLMQNLGVWANYVIGYSLLFIEYYMWYVFREVPVERDHYDEFDVDEDYFGFRRSVSRPPLEDDDTTLNAGDDPGLKKSRQRSQGSRSGRRCFPSSILPCAHVISPPRVVH